MTIVKPRIYYGYCVSLSKNYVAKLFSKQQFSDNFTKLHIYKMCECFHFKILVTKFVLYTLSMFVDGNSNMKCQNSGYLT